MFKKRFAGNANGGGGPRPGRDWLLLLTAVLLLIAASIGWNVWLFGRVAETEFSAEESASNVLKTYPAGAIQELFDDRAEMETAYRSSFLFVDPSR